MVICPFVAFSLLLPSSLKILEWRVLLILQMTTCHFDLLTLELHD